MAASVASAISYSGLSFSCTARFQAGNLRRFESQLASRVTRFEDAVGGMDIEMKGIRLQASKRTGSSGRMRARKGAIVPLAAIDRNENGVSLNGERDSLPNSPGSTRSPGRADRNTKGWTDERGNENTRLVAQLRNIALAARDRSEMHATIGLQRDNWNKLCHSTVVTTTVAAAILAAANSAVPALSFTLTAFLLNAGTAGLMILAGKMQPSQLAEEQRSAARQCKSMADEIEAMLQIDPRLREDAHLYMDDKLTRLRAVDMAYPLPLLPNGLPKFPEVVRPSIVNAQVDTSKPEMSANNSNGWSTAIAEDLKRTAEKLKNADIEIYLGWARKKERENLRLAIGAPALAAAAAFFNVLGCFSIGTHVHVSGFAAACSVMAMFCFSFAQGGQIGMIFEMYRNCAGSFADVDNTIQRAIRIPVCQREDGELLHMKIALQLGRQDKVPLVCPDDKTAGKVF